MSESKSPMQLELLAIMRGADELQKRLDGLDRRVNSKPQRAAIDSAQAGLRGWRGWNLGELLNEFDLPPDKRE